MIRSGSGVFGAVRFLFEAANGVADPREESLFHVLPPSLALQRLDGLPRFVQRDVVAGYFLSLSPTFRQVTESRIRRLSRHGVLTDRP